MYVKLCKGNCESPDVNSSALNYMCYKRHGKCNLAYMNTFLERKTFSSKECSRFLRGHICKNFFLFGFPNNCMFLILDLICPIHYNGDLLKSDKRVQMAR